MRWIEATNALGIYGASWQKLIITSIPMPSGIRLFVMPPHLLNTKLEGSVYANEADLLNLALFGETARVWKAENQNIVGNMRDNATAEQLLVLANLENLNAEFIMQGMNAQDQLQRLNEIAI